jgi:hypothetical protein
LREGLLFKVNRLKEAKDSGGFINKTSLDEKEIFIHKIAMYDKKNRYSICDISNSLLIE